MHGLGVEGQHAGLLWLHSPPQRVCGGQAESFQDDVSILQQVGGGGSWLGTGEHIQARCGCSGLSVYDHRTGEPVQSGPILYGGEAGNGGLGFVGRAVP